MGAYIGHYVDAPDRLFLAIAPDYQNALHLVDMDGQPDESSVRPIVHGLAVRVKLLRASWGLHFHPHDEPIVRASEDLAKLLRNPGTGPTGDILRSFGPRCPKCHHLHFENQECKAFFETPSCIDIPLCIDPTRPGEGAIVVQPWEGEVLTPAGYVQVADLELQDCWGLVPFRVLDDGYASDGPVVVEGDERALLEQVEQYVMLPVLDEEE